MGGTQQVCSPGQDSPGMGGCGGGHCSQDRSFVCVQVACAPVFYFYTLKLDVQIC